MRNRSMNWERGKKVSRRRLGSPFFIHVLLFQENVKLIWICPCLFFPSSLPLIQVNPFEWCKYFLVTFLCVLIVFDGYNLMELCFCDRKRARSGVDSIKSLLNERVTFDTENNYDAL